MSLTENQIIRYSRQILLAQVGGRGQEKLLTCGARLVGRGAAQATAAAYLAAGGIRVAPEEPKAQVHPEETGFLFSAADVGHPFAAALERATAEVNPDARRSVEGGLVGEVPAHFTGAAPWVALGWREGRGEVVYRSERGCADCFERQLGGLKAVPAGPPAVLVGTIAALAFQRLCLGASDDLGVVTTDGEGELQSAPVSRCLRCT